jgi:hypothetical protein
MCRGLIQGHFDPSVMVQISSTGSYNGSPFSVELCFFKMLPTAVAKASQLCPSVVVK